MQTKSFQTEIVLIVCLGIIAITFGSLLLANKITKIALAEETTEQVVIGHFTTDFSKSSRNRKHNIAVASQKINGAVIGIGETFSFNQTVGERTKENGFETALIIVDSKFVAGVGGGVCQVSTTLFNAAIRAGLTTSSVSHSLPVSYVKVGYDAMVSSAVDLTVTNNTNNPVSIKTECDENRITVSIIGIADDTNKNLKFWTKTLEVIEPKYETVFIDEKDEAGNPIERIVKEGKKGFLVATFVSKTDNQGNVSEKRLRLSSYKAVEGIVEKTRPEIIEEIPPIKEQAPIEN